MSALIAVIDNDEAVRDIIAPLAHHEGWVVSGYTYAEATLGAIQQLKPELIVLDFGQQEAGEDWQFLQLLKMEESTASIPVIVSAARLLLPLEIEGYLASRDINVLSKPFDGEAFISIARQVLLGQSALLLSTTKRLPILLAEDSDALSNEFMTILQMEGYLAVRVPNGKMALDSVRYGQHSLIFLDIMMPVMTGLEFLAAYALQPGPHTPVVIFSGEADLDDENFPPFVIGRLSKPFRIDELLTIVTKFAQPA